MEDKLNRQIVEMLQGRHRGELPLEFFIYRLHRRREEIEKAISELSREGVVTVDDVQIVHLLAKDVPAKTIRLAG